mmetsp:Transcript_6323/g.9290  ORF Transcript_6323/g.9290 Transcript_6323/m.9290 type:complete len:361 (-) Transcript_6323:292-1374(-)
MQLHDSFLFKCVYQFPVTDGEFLRFFERFGTVIDSVVMFDRDTRRSRGFGFVTFEDQTVAQTVLNLGDENSNEETDGRPRTGRIMIGGKACEVKAAEPKEASAAANAEHSEGRTGASIKSNQSYNSNSIRRTSSRNSGGSGGYVVSAHSGGKAKVDNSLTREKIASDSGNSRTLKHNNNSSQVADISAPPAPPESYYDSIPYYQRQDIHHYGVQYNPVPVAPGSYYPVSMAPPMGPVGAVYDPYAAYPPQGPHMMPYGHEFYEQDGAPAPLNYVPAPYDLAYYPPDGFNAAPHPAVHPYYQNFHPSMQPGTAGYYPMMTPAVNMAGYHTDGMIPQYNQSGFQVNDKSSSDDDPPSSESKE